MENYKEALQEFRKKNFLTQEQAGKLLGISRQSICNIEKGRTNISLIVQGKIEKHILGK